MLSWQASCYVLPDSIPSSIWDEFKAHRKKIKKPMTEYAETLILCKLEKWRLESGANPVDVLNESIEKGWSGVFLNGHAKTPGGQATGGGMEISLGRQKETEMRKAPKPETCAS